jgi:hypothetical protein
MTLERHLDECGIAPARPARAVGYSIGQATPSARPLAVSAVRINTIAPSVLTSTHVPALLSGKLTHRGPTSLPLIPHASRRVRPSTFDRRDREELRELLARLLTQIRYVATVFAVGMNMACEAPCSSEIAHGNDERVGQRADTGDVTIITANAGMIEINFIDRLHVAYDSRSLRIAKPAAAAARCLSVCRLRIEPAATDARCGLPS